MKKRVRLTALICALTLLFSSVYMPHATDAEAASANATDVPTLFRQNGVYSNEENFPLVVENGVEYVPLSLFSLYPYVDVTYSQNNDDFFLVNNKNNQYVSFNVDEGLASTHDGDLLTMPVETFNRTRYIPARTVALVLGFTYETYKDEETGVHAFRVSDGKTGNTLDEMIKPFVTETNQAEKEQQDDKTDEKENQNSQPAASEDKNNNNNNSQQKPSVSQTDNKEQNFQQNMPIVPQNPQTYPSVGGNSNVVNYVPPAQNQNNGTNEKTSDKQGNTPASSQNKAETSEKTENTSKEKTPVTTEKDTVKNNTSAADTKTDNKTGTKNNTTTEKPAKTETNKTPVTPSVPKTEETKPSTKQPETTVSEPEDPIKSMAARKVAMCYAGTDYDNMKKILDGLERYDIPASFSFTEDEILENPDILRRVYLDGHSLFVTGMAQGETAAEYAQSFIESIEAANEAMKLVLKRKTRMCTLPYDLPKEIADDEEFLTKVYEAGYLIFVPTLESGDSPSYNGSAYTVSGKIKKQITGGFDKDKEGIVSTLVWCSDKTYSYSVDVANLVRKYSQFEFVSMDEAFLVMQTAQQDN